MVLQRAHRCDGLEVRADQQVVGDLPIDERREHLRISRMLERGPSWDDQLSDLQRVHAKTRLVTAIDPCMLLQQTNEVLIALMRISS